MYTKNEAAAAITNTLKRKEGGGQKKRLEVDFSAGEIENCNRLIGLEEEEDTSSDNEMRWGEMRCKG